MAAAAALLGACGDDPTVGTGDPGQPATTSTTLAGQTYTSELTTTDGYRYRVTLLLGPRQATATPECPTTTVAGRYSLPVTLTVANLATDRPAPFPPLRLELAGAPGTRPGQVMVKDQAGACTFAPRLPSIAPGATVTFEGATPPVDEGSEGRVEVKVSESAFTLAAPLP